MEKLLADPQIQEFAQQVQQEQIFNKFSDKLTNECWDKCVSAPNSSKLDYKTEQCLVNCVDRFLDMANFITTRISQTATMANNANDANMEFEDKFSQPETKKSSWW